MKEWVLELPFSLVHDSQFNCLGLVNIYIYIQRGIYTHKDRVEYKKKSYFVCCCVELINLQIFLTHTVLNFCLSNYIFFAGRVYVCTVAFS